MVVVVQLLRYGVRTEAAGVGDWQVGMFYALVSLLERISGLKLMSRSMIYTPVCSMA
jgi:hypothetical protein